jgi:predicted NAD/FAD-binding protein
MVRGRRHLGRYRFIVFNKATYPHFIHFLAELEVPSQHSEMFFGFHCQKTGFAYAGLCITALHPGFGTVRLPKDNDSGL